MSHESRPIDPARFLEAITDLPVGNLYAKAAEIQNSIDHLKRSNDDLAEFQNDPDCKQAVTENLEVIKRMEDRIDMLKNEVTGRGLRWVEGEDYKEGFPEPGENAPATNGVNGSGPATNGNTQSNDTSQPATTAARSTAPSGTLTDEQLRRMLAERLGEPNDHDDEEGVHL